MTYVDKEGKLRFDGAAVENHWSTMHYEERDGFVLRVFQEEGDYDFNPRANFDGVLSTFMVECRNYIIGGAEQDGTVSKVLGRDDFSGQKALLRYMTLCHGAKFIAPLYLYDHSGISIRIGNVNTANSYWQHKDWDSSMIGFVFTTQARIEELGLGDRSDDAIIESIEAEVQEYDAYIRGYVFGYEIIDATTGEYLESCGGFIGFDADETAKEEGEHSLKSYIEEAK